MRIARLIHQNVPTAGFYADQTVLPFPLLVPLSPLAERFPLSDDLLTYLPHGSGHAAARELAAWVDAHPQQAAEAAVAASDVQLLVPIARPPKLFLLAGNYAKHIEEGGGVAAERAETFPYVFMKPPTTTLTHPGAPITIPRVSPDAIDWELELAVIIGRTAKGVSEAEALDYVAGYTVINDISNRRFRPNPARKQRDRDAFFDWLHGKWHDSFCPCGPCAVSADAVADPQALQMQLRVNGAVKQDASTAQQIFPVAAVIEFISSFVTLEPGDMISTGTAAGVGNTTGDFLQPGDQVEAEIEAIGVLANPVQGEA